MHDGRQPHNVDDAMLHVRQIQRMQDRFLRTRSYGLPRHFLILPLFHCNASRG